MLKKVAILLPLPQGEGRGEGEGAIRDGHFTRSDETVRFAGFHRSRACRWCFLFLFALAPLTLRAEDINIEAKLVWGTNSDKPPEPVIPEVDKPTADKLQNVFKWKHYFLCNKQNAFIPSRATKQIVLSKKCTVEITELPGPKVEVKLIGEGKPVNKTVKSLSKTECLVLAGDDKDKSAWFIVITQK